jgi:hypothetical protein
MSDIPVEQPPVQFRLVQIKTEEFAVIDGVFQTSVESLIDSQLSFGFTKDTKTVQVQGKFTFKQGDSPYLVVALSCWFHFPIPEDWNKIFDAGTGRMTLERDIGLAFSSIVIGTARGVIHSKSEGAPFHSVILPPINLLDLIEGDLIMDSDPV